MQQRRGTAAQWTSTNAGAGPVLNAGEIGWESDTNRFKIGDGVNNWSSLDYFADINSTVNPAFGTSITFEGATADSYETVLQVTDPTADRTITLPNVTGTVITTGNLSDITDIGVFTSTIVMEGTTADAHELTLSAGDPTADRTITFPDATGTVQLRVADVSDTEIGYLNGVTSAIQTQLDDKSTASKTETLTNKSISLASNTVTSTLAQLNTAISDADVATIAGTETLTNKTLTTPTINGPEITATGGTPRIHGIYLPEPHFITFEGATTNEFETVLTTIDPTADRTISLPDATGTVALTSDITVSASSTNTFTNKSIALGTNTVTGTLAEFNSAVTDADFASLAGSETFTNKTLASAIATTALTLNARAELRLADTDSSHYVGFKSPGTVAANKVWTLPAADGTAGQVLSTDGSATLSWATAAGGGGADEILVLMGAL